MSNNCPACGSFHGALDIFNGLDAFHAQFLHDLDRIDATRWMENHPEDYYPCPQNGNKLVEWVKVHPGAVLSEKNLQVSYEVLKAEGELIPRPKPQAESAPVQPQPKGQELIYILDSRTPETLSEYADHKLDTDIKRKRRDAKLADAYRESLHGPKGEWTFND
ncbi:MAG: hypothetical protein ACRD4X_14720 [Candidatus Acidiferrales bacterium]